MYLFLQKITAISNITLEIDNDLYCGGYNVQISFIRGYEKCLTNKKESFSRGDTLVWKNSELGNCGSRMIFDDFTKVQILSSDSNKFCPRLMKISSSEDFGNSDEFLANFTGWYNQETNNNTHTIEFPNRPEPTSTLPTQTRRSK